MTTVRAHAILPMTANHTGTALASLSIRSIGGDLLGESADAWQVDRAGVGCAAMHDDLEKLKGTSDPSTT